MSIPSIMPKNASIDGRRMEIVTPQMYAEHKELYANTGTAVEIEKDGRTYALPYRNQSDDRPGIYDAGAVYFIRDPQTPEENAAYDMEQMNVIDFQDTNGMKDFIQKTAQLRDIENQILTDADNIYIPIIGDEDGPEMVALKTAIGSKKCDINKYAFRFGPNFLNNKRLLKEKNITLNKLILMADNLDMEAELILRDKNHDVPNPMGQEVHAILTGGGDYNE